MNPYTIPGKTNGFSLVELLFVIAIIVLQASVAMNGLNNVTRSARVLNVAQRIADQISVARQTASSRNLPVEVRIYNLPDWDATSGSANYLRGMQLFIDDIVTNPISRPFYFPPRVIITSNSTISPILGSMVVGSTTLPNYGSVRYYSFTIRPNGILLPAGISDTNNFLTLFQDTADLIGALPKNFATLQIDPVTTKASILRPK